MPTLRYDGRRDLPVDTPAVANVAGVGPVQVGGTFEVSAERAAELMQKQRNRFSLVGPKGEIAEKPAKKDK